ncbi:flagellar basal body-associated FliL family protein [Reinekea blandensis]|uniref:Flagellar protein FliL n=1 Tax=Reinekea blandensis MED297 TaxID=314283 RepID=A4BKG6_9GAMM|nr:flagellar basal body-associated FliL family protein [Reinekea blandensis]EAR07365.1 flagellar protein [Reinekea sp. MED297] [Reinekea blandensis MED297]
MQRLKNRTTGYVRYLLPLIVSLAMSGHLSATPAAVGPSYVDLEPAFTLNYGDPMRTRYLQASITLRVRDQAAALEVTAHSDAIRHIIIMLFARQPEEKIRTAAGRDDILEQALRELQDLMLKETGKTLIDRVLFTSFVLQT